MTMGLILLFTGLCALNFSMLNRPYMSLPYSILAAVLGVVCVILGFIFMK